MQRWALALDLSLEDSVDRLHLGQFDTTHIDFAIFSFLLLIRSFYPDLYLRVYFPLGDSDQLDIQVWRSSNACEILMYPGCKVTSQVIDLLHPKPPLGDCTD